MVDCGKDWQRRLWKVAPTSIVLTHAHADHAWGLVEGAPCPVYATIATWALIDRFPICDRREMPTQKSVMIGGVRFRACPVQHSIRAPAVGYRVSAEGSTMFYVPDVAELPHAAKVLRGIDVYIGDGATIKRSLVRRRGRTLIGHAPIAAQLDSCKRASVKEAVLPTAVHKSCRAMHASLTRWFGVLAVITASRRVWRATAITCHFPIDASQRVRS